MMGSVVVNGAAVPWNEVKDNGVEPQIGLQAPANFIALETQEFWALG
jgi:hypothetical protein